MPFHFPVGFRRILLLCVPLALILGGIGMLVASESAPKETRGTTTIFVVRHAEKAPVAPDDKDPVLSAAGKARAQLLARMLADSGVAAIFATSLQRTQLTVRPLAEKLGLDVTVLPVRETAELVRQIRSRAAGGAMLVAGHNTTVPEIIAGLGGPAVPPIPETEYDRLYVFTLPPVGPATVVLLRY